MAQLSLHSGWCKNCCHNSTTFFGGSITMSSHSSLSYPLHLVDVVSRRRASHKSQSSCFAYNARPSPILLKSDGLGNLSDPKNLDASSSASRSGLYSPMPHPSSTIGVMAVSATSTLRFLEKLVHWSARDGEVPPPFIICNDPLIKKELLAFETSPRSSDSHNSLVANLRQKRLFLEQSGARCIVMPCQFLHAWHDEISQGCSVPFIHVGDCIVKELKAANFKPVEYGSNVRVGVLATENTLTTNYYQEKLQNQGFEVLCPDKATIEHTVQPAVGAFRRKDMEGARNLLRIALQVLLVRAVNTIILASDDFVGILPNDDPLLKKCIDPIDALVREAMTWAKTLSTSECDG